MKPRIFISAVSSELATARQDVANVLTRLGYEPVWQDVFGTEPGALKAILREKIDDCEGLIHIVGKAYGTEASEPDHAFGRVSYTQYEFLYAKKQGKKTWIIFAEEGCTRDTPLDALDLPRDQEITIARNVQSERRTLQDAWRLNLKVQGHLRHAAASDAELKLKINELSDEFSKLRRGFRRWQKLVLGSSAIVVILLVVIIIGLIWQWRDWETSTKATQTKLDSIWETQAVTTAKIRAHLIEATDKSLKIELAAADQEPRYDEREKRKDLARKSYDNRLVRIDDLAKRFAELDSQVDVSEDTKEMVRILRTEEVNAVDKAIAFAEKGQQARFDRVRQRRNAEQQQNRLDLQADLKVASLADTSGQIDKARRLFDEIVSLEPDWPEAIETYSWFLYDRSRENLKHGDLQKAMLDTDKSFELASRLHAANEKSSNAQRLLGAIHHELGTLLRARGRLGDDEQALLHFEKSLAMANAAVAENPNSDVATRDSVLSIEEIAYVLMRRGKPGDDEKALQYFERGLKERERILEQHPESALATRDVAVSLSQVGDFLFHRWRQGDADIVFEYYTRSREIYEKLLANNPDSAKALRDQSIAFNSLGDFLMKRQQPGDVEQAYEFYTKCYRGMEAIYQRNSTSTQAGRDLTLVLDRLGDYLARRRSAGDVEQAIEHYTRALEIRDLLLAANPDSSREMHGIFISRLKLAQFYARRGQNEDAGLALENFSAATEMATKLRDREPKSGEPIWELALAHTNHGAFEMNRGHFADAIPHFQKGVLVADQLLEKNLMTERAKQHKSFLSGKIGECEEQAICVGDWVSLLKSPIDRLPDRLMSRTHFFANRRQLSEVAQSAAKLHELCSNSQTELTNNQLTKMQFDAARAYSLCAEIAGEAAHHSNEEHGEMKKRFISLALDCLKEAIAKGFSNFDQMRADADLTILRGLPEFEALFPAAKAIKVE